MGQENKPVTELNDSDLSKFDSAIKGAFKDGGTEKMARPKKESTVISKLKDEANEVQIKIDKLSDKIINPFNISDGQIELMRAQYNSMRTTYTIIKTRIRDLEN